MRRCLALSGALYFVLALLLPLLAASAAESRIPLCCRRAGMHHCAGRSQPGDTPGVSDVNRCAQWPHAVAAQHRQDFRSGPEFVQHTGLVPAATLRVRSAEMSQVARARQSALRGPPSLA